MKCLIIAAGNGSRLSEFTKDNPKPLIKILGRSLIERVILTIKEAGIKDFVIVIGYLGDKIREALSDGHKLGVKINYIVNRDLDKGNGVSVFKGKELINENFILTMSDHLCDVRVVKRLINYNLKSAVALAIDRKEPTDDDTKVFEKNNKIFAIGKKIEDSNCIDTGMFLCSPKIFDYLEEEINNDRTELSHGIANASRNNDAEIFDITEIESYTPNLRKCVPLYWQDTDTKEDIKKSEKLLIRNACKGTNDLLATYINKPIENFIVKRIANTKITPNQVTFFTNIIAYIATFLFLTQNFLLASIITFVVSFLDGVDGKLSRVKMLFSRIGKLEHAFDFLFEHSWYIAFAVVLSKTHGIYPVMLCVFVLLFDGFAAFSDHSFGLGAKGRPIHDYGRAERIFRKFDGRKNSYIILILIGVLFNMPFYSLVAIAFWSFVSATFYCVRMIKDPAKNNLAL